MAGHIYLVTNTLNGKQYVGQSMIETNKVGHGRLMVKAYKKYSRSAFTYEKICSDINNRPTLNFIEKFWIKVMDCRVPNGYNVDAGGSLNDAEVYAKVSASMKGKVTSEATKEKIRAGNLGKVVSAETRAKLSAKRQKQVITEETKIKLSEAAKRQWARQKGVA